MNALLILTQEISLKIYKQLLSATNSKHHGYVIEVVEHSLSMQEVWGSIPHFFNSCNYKIMGWTPFYYLNSITINPLKMSLKSKHATMYRLLAKTLVLIPCGGKTSKCKNKSSIWVKKVDHLSSIN